MLNFCFLAVAVNFVATLASNGEFFTATVSHQAQVMPHVDSENSLPPQQGAFSTMVRRSKDFNTVAVDVEGRTTNNKVTLRRRGDQDMLVNPAAPSMVELGVVDRIRLFTRQVETSVLIVAVILAFVLGMLISCCMLALLKSGKGGHEPTAQDFADASAEIGMAMARAPTMVATQVERLLDKIDSMHSSDEESSSSADENAYDFETVDEDLKKIHRWEWCNEAQILKMGLLTQAPTKPYDDHYRLDSEPNTKDVEELLSKHDVDFTLFDRKQDLDHLLWRLLRAEGYFMTTDANSGSILFMIETVRLRCKFGDRVLVQDSGSTILGAKKGLPGVPKEASESPAAAAERFWTQWFKLPKGSAVFVEDTVEQSEIADGINGLRCVETAFLIDVNILTEDPVILKKLGLPEFDTFVASPHTAGHDDTNANFEWMTKVQCNSSGIVITDYDTLNKISDSRIAGLDTEENEASRIEKLSTFLKDAGVDIESWSQHSHGNRIQSLAKELSTGKCYITKTGSGLPQRCVNVVALRLLSPDRRYMLVDKMRIHTTTGAEEPSPQLPGAKKDYQETLVSAALRICDRQLHFTEDNVEIGYDATNWEYFEYTEPSQRYTGLLTKYQKFFMDITLDDSPKLIKQVGLTQKDMTVPKVRFVEPSGSASD